MSQADALLSNAAARRAVSRPGRAVRFSLLTLVLGVLLLSSIGLLYWSHSDLRRLQAENAELKEKAGVLNISDPSKVHLVRVPSASSNEWRWNLYVPKGKVAIIRAMERVESNEKWKPREIWSTTLSRSELESFGVLIDRDRGEVVVEDPRGVSTVLPLPAEYQPWVRAGNYVFDNVSAGKTVLVSGITTALIAQLQVVDPTAKVPLLTERSASGFQIQIEERDTPTTK